MKIEPSTVFKVPDHVLARRVDEDMILLDLKAGEYFGLEGVGASVWGEISAGKSFAECLDSLGKAFSVDSETLRADATVLISDLESNQLIEILS